MRCRSGSRTRGTAASVGSPVFRGTSHEPCCTRLVVDIRGLLGYNRLSSLLIHLDRVDDHDRVVHVVLRGSQSERRSASSSRSKLRLTGSVMQEAQVPGQYGYSEATSVSPGMDFSYTSVTHVHSFAPPNRHTDLRSEPSAADGRMPRGHTLRTTKRRRVLPLSGIRR